VTRQQIDEAAQRLRDNQHPERMWIIVTRLSPAEAEEFYESPTNRPGWEMVANTAGCCLLLRRASYDLMVA
jgi:hypothetical protein